MAKYVLANKEPLVRLKYNPYQLAFLDALRMRVCPKCFTNFSMQWSNEASLQCPECGARGLRAFDVASLIAGRQGGKTRIVTLAAALEMALPNVSGWICAPTFRDQELFVKPAFFKQVPQSWLDQGDWQASNDLFIAPNGSQVAFVSLDDPDAVRGPTLDFIVIDEACKISPKAWEVAQPALSIKGGVALITTTPKGQDWVYDQIYLPAENGTPGYWTAKYKSIENPLQSRAYIESKRRTMSPEMFKQEYEAEFVTFEGAIYGALPTTCEISDEEVKKYIPEWPRIDPARESVAGLDPGSDHPFAGCIAVKTPSGLIVIGEYLERERAAKEHASELKVMAQGLSPTWGCDRSQAQMMIELAQHKIFARGAENDVDAGIERVKSWMLSGQLKIVKSRCPRLLQQLLSYRWADTEKTDGSKGKPTPYKRLEDLCDAFRYMLMTWPYLPQPAEVQIMRDLSQMPDKMRHDIERLQRRMKADEEKVKDGVGDFYSEYDEGEYEPMSGSEFAGFYA